MPRDTGFVSMYFECRGKAEKFLFTFLDRIHQDSVNAIPSIILHSFPDLREARDIVLLKGDVDTKVMTTQEAQVLINIMQVFLLDDAKYKLLDTFNRRPQLFNFDEVVRAVEEGLQK